MIFDGAIKCSLVADPSPYANYLKHREPSTNALGGDIPNVVVDTHSVTPSVVVPLDSILFIQKLHSTCGPI
jgi:hypothetical protein